MKALKKFIDKKKNEAKFRQAGPGHRLDAPPAAAAVGAASSSGGSSSGASIRQPRAAGCQMAGAAAQARLDQQKQRENSTNRQLTMIRSQARKELEDEMAAKTAAAAASKAYPTAADAETDTDSLAVSGVFFKCSLIGPEVLPRAEIEARIREFLFDQLSQQQHQHQQQEEEDATVACLIVKTCNKNREQREAGVALLCRYLDNIAQHPDEPKYRRIRLGNRVYQQRVAPLCGATQFLRAAGFRQVTVQPTANVAKQDGGASDGQDGGAGGGQDGGASGGQDGGSRGGQDGGATGGHDGGASCGQDGGASCGQDGGASGVHDGGATGGQDGGATGIQSEADIVWEMKENFDVEYLQTLREALLMAEPILPELDRNVRVLMPAHAAVQCHLPAEFFKLTVDELKREEQLRRDLVESLTTLQTRESRERQKSRDSRRYRYCLVRVRFPDSITLQGTFHCSEPVSAVFDFVRDCLADQYTGHNQQQHDQHQQQQQDEGQEQQQQQPPLQFTLRTPTGRQLDATGDATVSLLDADLVPSTVLLWQSTATATSTSSSSRCVDNTTIEGATASRQSHSYLKPELMALVSSH